MTFNVKKDCMYGLQLTVSRKVVSYNFLAFTADDDKLLEFVDKFNYLGSIVTKELHDDADIDRKIKIVYSLGVMFLYLVLNTARRMSS